MEKGLQEKVLNILQEEIVPAEGCTEPIAIAYAAARLAQILGEKAEKIDIYLSGNMIKNVKSVFIPSSEGMVGIEAAVAMGFVAGDAEKELMVISDVTKEQLEEVKRYYGEKEYIPIRKREILSYIFVLRQVPKIIRLPLKLNIRIPMLPN